MKRYIGTKTINATPMNRGEYNAYRAGCCQPTRMEATRAI